MSSKIIGKIEIKTLNIIGCKISKRLIASVAPVRCSIDAFVGESIHPLGAISKPKIAFEKTA